MTDTTHAALHVATARSGPAWAIGSQGAALTSALLITAAHLLTPNHDPVRDPISDLAHSPHGWVMTLGFLSWGIAGFCCALALRHRDSGVWTRLCAALVALAALGPLLAGIFPADPMTAPSGAETWQGVLHGAGAMLSDVLLPASVLASLVLVRTGRPLAGTAWSVRLATAGLWLAAIVLTVLMATAPIAGDLTSGPPLGWINRVHVAACLAFVAVLAAAVRRAHR